MSELGLTANHIKEMRHMVGLDYQSPKRGKYEAFRNYAMYYPDNNPRLARDLVEWGLADVRMGTLELTYWLNQAGLDLLGEMIGAKITVRR